MKLKSENILPLELKNQQRVTRAKTIGEKYIEESIKNRIETRKEYKNNFNKDKRRTRKIINTEEEKFKESNGLIYCAKNQNLNIMADNFNQLSKYNIKSFIELDELLDTKHLDITRNSEEIKEIEWKINELKERKLAIKDYKKYRNTYKKYEIVKDKDRYYQAFTSEILLYKAARRKLGNQITKEVLTSILDIESEISNLNKQKQTLLHFYQWKFRNI